MSGSRPYTLDFRFRTKNCYPTNGIRKLWTLNRKHWRKSPDAGNATCGHMNVKTNTNQHKRCSKSKKNHFLLFEIWSFAVKEIAVVRKWRQNVRLVKISTTHNIWNANAFGSGSLACFLHFFLESLMISCWTLFFNKNCNVATEVTNSYYSSWTTPTLNNETQIQKQMP